VAIVVLTGLAVVTPWAMGSVSPLAVRCVTLLALGGALAAVVVQFLGHDERSPVVPVWPVVAFLALGLLQLLPLPALLHAVLAPGSCAVWHPADPAVAAVLGDGMRPASVDPAATARSLLLAAGLVALAVLAAPALADVTCAARVAVALTVSGLALSIYAIVARAIFGALLFGRYAVPTISPFGPFVSKNHFAGHVEMAALVAFGLALGLADRERDRSSLDWVRSPRAIRVLLAAGAALVMSLAILASLSRGGILSLGAGVLLLLWIRRSTRRESRAGAGARFGLPLGLIALAVAGVSLFLLLPREAQERIAGITGAASEQSGSFRLDTWRDSLRLAASSPLIGQGLGGFAESFPRFKQGHGELRVDHAESDVLEVLAEAGMVGLGLGVLTVLLLAHAVHGGLRRRSAGPQGRGGDRLRRGIGAGALAAVLALVVHSGFDFNLRIPSNAALFALATALAAGSAGGRDVSPAPGRARLVVTGALLIVGLVWGFRIPLAPVSAGRDDVALAASIRRPEGRALRLARADAALVASLRTRPADAESWYMLAWTRAALARAQEARALAGYARSLDPTRPSLREAIARLEAALAEARTKARK